MSIKQVILKMKTKHIVVLLFILSLAFGYFWNHRFYFKPVPSGDEMQYSCIAENILKNHIYTNCDYIMPREPGYPFFVAFFYSVFNYHPDAVRFAQLFLFALISVLIYLLAWRFFDKKVALISGLFSSLWWGFANYTGRYTREILIVFLFLVLLHFLYEVQKRQKNIFFILSAFIFGLIVLIHGAMKYFLLFIILNLFFILRKKLNFKALLFKIAIFLVVFLITLSPWLIRNKISHKDENHLMGYMLTMRSSLMNRLYPEMPKYYLGHIFGYYFVQKFYPDFNSRAFREGNEAIPKRKELTSQGKSLAEADKIMEKEAIREIVNNPHKYLAMSILDFLNLNSPLIPQRIFGGNSYAHFTFLEYPFSYLRAFLFLVFRLWWIGFIFLVFWSFFKLLKNWEKYSWLILLIVYINAIYSAVFAIPRYASPMYPAYIILFAFACVSLYDKYVKNKFKT